VSITEAAKSIVEELSSIDEADRLELLIEYANSLPPLPPRYADHPDLLERVEECQSPVFLFVEVQANVVNVFLTAPAEAPTTRAFASILQKSLDGESVRTVLEFDNEFPNQLGLTKLVSPLRMRGIHGMLARIKRQVSEKSA
jgi:cysteine desulfuration protein SufE